MNPKQANSEKNKWDVKDKIIKATKATGEEIASIADTVGKAGGALSRKTTDSVVKLKEAVFNTIDQNGDGEIGIDDVIIMGLNVPGIRIEREVFLRKEFRNKYTKEVTQTIKIQP